ncbi:P63C domain-containing protein [Nitrobacter vulgaris]|uniref:Bacteriophage Mx8 p63 C-terminal domain-containing protein n=1 Tax=Nitrobacter vulgaris TaxID=29421 RepID=A0A1V4HZ79_NITVU|nr:P63C domain-containing protein [Nitrobacter vulgaris]OPH83175.1 hypothetical protein B2M20_08305 [Nitrobacter vulgaris]
MESVSVKYGSPDNPLKLGDITIECYVLEDGERVLLYSDIQSAMGFASGGSMVAGKNRLELFASRNRIAQNIPRHIQLKLESPIEIKKPSGAKAYALPAEVLPALCEAVVAAARMGVLQEQQLFIAHQCEVLLSGLSRVGIIALVDEATGYQRYREEQALQKILDAYILPEHRPWMKAVPVEFFQEMFRVFGWQHKAGNRGPRYAGKLVRNLIYRHLPKPVLPKLDEMNPSLPNYQRKYRHHQLLTEGFGLEHFRSQMSGVMALLRASNNRNEFNRLYLRAYGGQLDLDLGDG